jgi:hypothetical protein
MGRTRTELLLADIRARLSMWWEQRCERRLAVRRYRAELRTAGRRCVIVPLKAKRSERE